MLSLDPIKLMIEAFNRGMATVDEVVRTAWGPEVQTDWFQKLMIEAALRGLNGEFREVWVKGATSSGKGACAAMIATLWFASGDDTQVIVNSNSTQHARDVLFAEIKTWYKLLRFPGDDEILETKIKGANNDKKYIVIANPEKGESFSGRHGTGGVLFLFDEASSASPHFFDLAKTQAKMILCLGNPRVSSGFFRRAFGDTHADDPYYDMELPSGSKRRIITISGESLLNVKTGLRLIPGQLTKEDYAELINHPDPNYRRVYAQGKFPLEDQEVQLILPSWLERHVQAYNSKLEPEAFGLDVADSDDGDKTVLSAVHEDGLIRQMIRQKANTMQTVGWVVNSTKNQWKKIDITEGQHPVVVDADGLGTGVADRLEELGVWVVRHRGSESAYDRRSYVNRRAESYATLARRLDPSSGMPPFGLPDKQELLDDICAPERIYDSDGIRFRIPPKDLPSGSRPIKNHRGDNVSTIRQKLSRSPDYGDSLAYGYWGSFVLHGGIDGIQDQQIVPKEESVVFCDEDAEAVTPKKTRDKEWDTYFSELGDLLDDLESKEADGEYKLD